MKLDIHALHYWIIQILRWVQSKELLDMKNRRAKKIYLNSIGNSERQAMDIFEETSKNLHTSKKN
jgi:hypothetical protein